MATAVSFGTPINELNSWSFTADLSKDDGTPLGPTALDTLTLTLYDTVSDTILNSVDQVDIKNTGRATLDANGHLVVNLVSADNPMVNGGAQEQHKALIIGIWNSGAGYMSLEVSFNVCNVHRVP